MFLLGSRASLNPTPWALGICHIEDKRVVLLFPRYSEAIIVENGDYCFARLYRAILQFFRVEETLPGKPLVPWQGYCLSLLAEVLFTLDMVQRIMEDRDPETPEKVVFTTLYRL